jgi:hypothetical protein
MVTIQNWKQLQIINNKGKERQNAKNKPETRLSVNSIKRSVRALATVVLPERKIVKRNQQEQLLQREHEPQPERPVKNRQNPCLCFGGWALRKIFTTSPNENHSYETKKSSR